MSTVAFDTYAQVKQLVQTGVPEAQAEVIINIVAGATMLPGVSKLATKDDFLMLIGELSQLRTELKGDSDKLRVELRGEIDKLRLELNGDIKGLKGELIWWILGAVGFTAAFPQILAHLPK